MRRLAPVALLRLAETPVLIQQLRLITGNMRSTFWPAVLLAVLVRFAWVDDSNITAMNLWCALKAVVELNVKVFIHRFERLVDGPMAPQTARRMVWWLVANSVFGGILWSGLIWIAPQAPTLAQGCLIFALIAVVTSGSVSTVSVLLPVFFAFNGPVLAVLLLNPQARGILEQPLAAVGFALYVLTLVDQAIKGAKASRAAIELRFENAALLEDLRAESAALSNARRDAERASAAKSRMLAAASHDLRQPVHAQGLFLEVLARTELSLQQRQLLACANEAVTASASMLGTLFDFSRIEAGVIQPQRTPFAIQPLLNKIEREFAPLADAKGLTYRSRESGLIVHSDAALVELILRNLVSNAIRYTRQGGLLVVCRLRGGQALLEVWDTGIGIAQSQQREVFREFYQLDNPERDRRKGFGLGLTIVEGLSRTLAHELSMRSRLQRGSVFRLALPLSGEPLPLLPTDSSPALPRALTARVLVIDDDAAIQAGMLQLLSSWGCSCDVVDSVEQALQRAKQRSPDLVISDYRLREPRSGLDAISELRTLLGERLAVLLVTGDTSPDKLQEAARRGVTLLHKPVLPDDLYRAVVTAMID